MPINDNSIHARWRTSAHREDSKDAELERLREENERLREQNRKLLEELNAQG